MPTSITVNALPKAASPGAQQQWIRKANLIVSNGPGSQGIDLSQLRFKFHISQWDLQTTPNYIVVRIYNLAEDTAQQVQKEFTSVHLDAGYEGGNFGAIFDGTIKMVRRGRESPIDTYLDILAADADIARNFTVVNKSYKAGVTAKTQFDDIASAMQLPQGYVADMPVNALSRGKVLFGMARRRLDNLSATQSATWSVQNGQIQFIPLTAYRPDEAVVLNSNTGMIDLPEQTQDGIRVRCLLNPNIRIGTLLQINNKSIQRAFLGGQNLFNMGRLEDLPGLLPKVTDDGFYRTYVAEHVGDMRGQEWYTNIICLAVDRSAPQGQQVKAYG